MLVFFVLLNITNTEVDQKYVKNSNETKCDGKSKKNGKFKGTSNPRRLSSLEITCSSEKMTSLKLSQVQKEHHI